MVETELDYSTIQAKSYLAENTRPFFWVGLLCAAYGYIPYALYEVPVLLNLGLWMASISLGVRAFSAPLISSLQIVRQVWSGSLPVYELVKRLTLLFALLACSLGGTILLGKCFSRLAGLG
jgi:hypothetical protein